MRDRIYAVIRSALCLAACTYAVPAIAQVLPDGTLPVNSLVTPNGNSFVIEGGTTAGANLFHSFSEFSLPTGTEALFNNASSIENILSRVTGGNISSIDGLIRANGGANLFLINPSGIVFGPSASLNIGGSFFASSAESIVFENGIAFSASNPQASPLLTINVPLGLQWGNNPQPVVVSGSSLAVEPGKNLTVAAGTVNLDGASLLAPAGRVELSSVAQEGQVPLGSSSSISRSALGGEIQLENTQIDATSATGGTIAVNAGNLSLRASNLSAGLSAGGSDPSINGGAIAIDVAGQTSLNDRSLIANDVQAGAVGNGGNIALTTGSLELSGGSRIQTVTNSTGSSGEIAVNANGVINISGFTDDGLFSGILSRSATPNSGTGGNISINNPQASLNLSNQGFVAAVTNSSSDGGEIAGEIGNVTAASGGQILTATTNSGNAGNIALNVSGNVSLSGENTAFVENPFLSVSAFNIDTLPFSTEANTNVESSGNGGIPYVTIERKETEIVSGNTVLGAAEEGVDYYSFSVTKPNSRVIIDIDGGVFESVYLLNRTTGELLAVNWTSSPNDGGLGSTPVIENVTGDSYIATEIAEPGVYLVGIAGGDSFARTNQVISGEPLQVGNTYTLNLSIQSPGNLPLPTLALPGAGVFNPNLSVSSGLFSETSNSGSAGNIALNSQQLSLSDFAQIANRTSALGRGGDLGLNVGSLLSVDNADIETATLSRGNAGNIAVSTGRLEMTNNSQLQSATFGEGNAGNVSIAAREHISLTGENLNRAERLLQIASLVTQGATGNGGDIIVETPMLRLADGGAVRVSNEGLGNAGNIEIRAGEIEAIGAIASSFNASGIFASNIGQGGEGGDISIDANRVLLLDEGRVQTTTASSGDAGDIFIRTTESLEIAGTNPTADFFAGIFSQASPLIARTGSGGRGGNIKVETNALRLADGGQITSATQSSGNAGNIDIRATDIEVSSAFVDFFGISSGISASVGSRATASGGSITLEADRLRVFDGGQIAAPTGGGGVAGNLNIRADEVVVEGISGESPSTISAESTSDFAAGSIDIQADRLQVRDRGEITVSSTGAGDAGNLNITADRLDLDTGGRLSSEVQAGSQGNINLTTDSLQLRRGSITTNASETATGGNIKIDSETVALIQNSQITADAIQGAGGNISISTEGIFVSPDSSITASSEFGVDGIVEINNLDTDSSQGLVELSQTPDDPNTRIVSGCAVAEGNSFVVTGRGGLPPNPEEQLIGDRSWTDLRDLSAFRGEVGKNTSPEYVSVEGVEGAIVEANSWRTNDRGEIELVAVVEASHPAFSSLPPKCQGSKLNVVQSEPSVPLTKP